jgi:hypothetical protein
MPIRTMKKKESDFVKNSSLLVNTKKVEKQRTTIDLTPEEYKFLKDQKENEGISFRGTIRKALREYMKKHEE